MLDVELNVSCFRRISLIPVYLANFTLPTHLLFVSLASTIVVLSQRKKLVVKGDQIKCRIITSAYG